MLLEMTITFCELNSNFLPVQFRVGVKNCPFFFFFLPGVFSFLSELFNDAVFVKRDSMCMVKQAFRLYSHSFVKKTK